jgi:subtilisin family serine protease
MPAGFSPIEVLIAAMDPYLGVRELHREGITGKGVSVAIIDQPMFLDHPQFAGKVAAYKDFDSQTDSSMHGPAVSSLLVGTNLGTAPEATLYYAAVPSWRKDSEYYAQALAWLLELNRSLPPERKIRVVSVSAAPSGPGTPYEKNTELWDWAFAAAEQEGVLVLDCTQNRGRTGPCYFNFSGDDRENPANCRPGYPGLAPNLLPGRILAPASPRTTAEEYIKGEFGYQYTGRGGLSWTPPYIAGILALAWQLRPDLSPSQLWDLLLQSAYAPDDVTRIVHPKAFLALVRSLP